MSGRLAWVLPLLLSCLPACRTPASPAPRAEEGGEVEAGPRVGQAIPHFEGRDQKGVLQSFRTLAGPRGLMLNFNRSVLL